MVLLLFLLFVVMVVVVVHVSLVLQLSSISQRHHIFPSLPHSRLPLHTHLRVFLRQGQHEGPGCGQRRIFMGIHAYSVSENGNIGKWSAGVCVCVYVQGNVRVSVCVCREICVRV